MFLFVKRAGALPGIGAKPARLVPGEPEGTISGRDPRVPGKGLRFAKGTLVVTTEARPEPAALGVWPVRRVALKSLKKCSV